VVERLDPHPARVEAAHQRRVDDLEDRLEVGAAAGLADHLPGGGGEAELDLELLPVVGHEHGPAGLLGVLLQLRPLGRPGAFAVERHVDRHHPAHLAVAAVEGRHQQVERVPGVGLVADLDVRHPAEVGDVEAHPLVGDEAQHAPVVGGVDLRLDLTDGRAVAEELLPRGVAARDGDDLDVAVLTDEADRAHLEAGHVGDALGDQLEGIVEDRGRPCVDHRRTPSRRHPHETPLGGWYEPGSRDGRESADRPYTGVRGRAEQPGQQHPAPRR
jgi:hypothetical protein